MLSAIRPFALVALTLLAAVIIIAVWLLGTSGKAERRGETIVLRYAIGPKLVGVPFGLGVLWLVWLIVASAIEEEVSALGDIFLITLTTALFIAWISLILAKSFFARIEYDEEKICARMDRILNRTHCHRWADLMQIEDTDREFVLHFSDGGRVILSVGMFGYRDLKDRAVAALERRKDDTG